MSAITRRLVDAEQVRDSLRARTEELQILRWLLAEREWQVAQMGATFHEQVQETLELARSQFELAADVSTQTERHARSVVDQTVTVVEELSQAFQQQSSYMDQLRWLHAEARHYWDVWRTLYFERKGPVDEAERD